MDREPDGSTYHGSPACRCGSRATRRVEDKFLVRFCSVCHSTYYYRLHDGLMLAFPQETAQEIDEMRAEGWK